MILDVSRKIFNKEVMESLESKVRRGLSGHPVQLILGLWILFVKYLWWVVIQPIQVVQTIWEWEKQNIMLTDFACFLQGSLGPICPAWRPSPAQTAFASSDPWYLSSSLLTHPGIISLLMLYYNHIFMCLFFLWTVGKWGKICCILLIFLCQ